MSDSPIDTPAQAGNSRLFLLIFLAALAGFGPFVTDFYLPTLPQQQTDFNTSASMVQLGLSTTMWGLAIGQLFFGPLSDQHGRRGPLAVSLTLFAGSTLGAIFAPSIEWFVAMRFLEGIGASGAVVMSRSVAADRYVGRELAGFMGVMGGIQGVAPVLAPMVGAVIAEMAGWRDIFMLLFVIGTVLLIVTSTVFKESLPRARRTTGGLTSGVELRRLFTDPVFIAVVAQQFFASAVLFGHIAASPFVFQTHYGLSPSAYGLLFGGLALAVTAGAVSAGRFASPAAAMETGAWGMLAGSILVAMIFSIDGSVPFVVPAFAVLLLSLGLTLPSAMALVLSRHRERAGAAAALLGAIGFLSGGIIAPLTTAADPILCVSVIFLLSAIILVVIAIRMRPLTREPAGRGEPLPINGVDSDESRAEA